MRILAGIGALLLLAAFGNAVGGLMWTIAEDFEKGWIEK